MLVWTLYDCMYSWRCVEIGGNRQMNIDVGCGMWGVGCGVWGLTNKLNRGDATAGNIDYNNKVESTSTTTSFLSFTFI